MIKKFRNFKIGMRLKIIFSVIVIAFIVFMAVSAYSITKISKDLHLFYDEPYKISTAALKSKEAFEAIQKIVYKIGTISDRNSIESLLEDLNEYSIIFNENFRIIKNGLKGNMELVYDIEKKLLQSASIRNELLKSFDTKSNLSLEILQTSYLPTVESIQSSLDSIINESSQQALSFIQTSDNAKFTTIVFLTILFFVLIIYIECVYFSLIKSIANPIEKIDRVATQVADGNLEAKIDYECKDEIGNLVKNMCSTINVVNLYISNISNVLSNIADKNLKLGIEIEYIGDFAPIKKSMENILSSMSFTLKNIKNVAKQVNMSSESIAQVSQTIAYGATEQSSSVEELVATFNMVAEQINKTALDAKSINTKSSESIQLVNSGDKYMQQLLEYMDKLNCHTQNISKITKVVDDISHQTKMLSLNAAIEAAKAGQSGKGFAIVADEIGKLANETAKATKDISNLIDDSINAVNEGLHLTENTASIFKEIVSVSEKTDILIENITSACENESDSINEILKAIEQISDVIQSNSAIAQQTSASSQQLLSQAELVTELLDEFQLPI